MMCKRHRNGNGATERHYGHGFTETVTDTDTGERKRNDGNQASVATCVKQYNNWAWPESEAVAGHLGVVIIKGIVAYSTPRTVVKDLQSTFAASVAYQTKFCAKTTTLTIMLYQKVKITAT